MRAPFLRPSVLLSALLIAAGAACASSSGGTAADSAPRSDRSQMDTLEFRNKSFRTIYEAIKATHADWLIVVAGNAPRLAAGVAETPSIGIFVEGQTRTQPVEYLLRLTPDEVKSVKRISASEALAKYGWPWNGLLITPGR